MEDVAKQFITTAYSSGATHARLEHYGFPRPHNNASYGDNVGRYSLSVRLKKPEFELMPAAAGLSLGQSYTPAYFAELNKIGLPQFETFHDPDEYYLTMMHELAHATHKPLARKLGMYSPFYVDGAACLEEVVAETAREIAGAKLGLKSNPMQYLHYTGGWLRAGIERRKREDGESEENCINYTVQHAAKAAAQVLVWYEDAVELWRGRGEAA